MGLKQPEIAVTIDGREYSSTELDTIEIDRSYFMLRELAGLGAVVFDQHSRPLSESEVDSIPRDRVRWVLLDNKMRLGKAGLDALFEGQYREADEMWRGWVASSGGDFGQKVARTHLTITGLTARHYAKLIASMLRINTLLLAVEPEHIVASMTNITEIMGMYGPPTQMKGSIGAKSPIPLDEDHPLRLIGASHLAAAPNIVNAIAVHQVKLIPGGIDFLAAACFPSAAPQELVDGHSIHMAIEISNVFRVGLRL